MNPIIGRIERHCVVNNKQEVGVEGPVHHGFDGLGDGGVLIGALWRRKVVRIIPFVELLLHGAEIHGLLDHVKVGRNVKSLWIDGRHERAGLGVARY